MASKTQPSAVDRRRFLHYTWRTLGSSLGLALLPGASAPAPRLGRNPFTLGVASGDPTPDGIVLWTRLAPEPANPESLGSRAIAVHWRVARDRGMRDVVASGRALAASELAHSVHVEVAGLSPESVYFYQFHVRGEESPIGQFRTAPAEDSLVEELRFAFASCQDWQSGYYVAYRDLLDRELDFVLHLGDYTYEQALGSSRRGVPPPPGFEAEAVDLRSYRLRHTLYKLDPDLQAAHARFPFIVSWDDHEVSNDYSGLAPAYGSPSPEFSARRSAAYQAYYEHMPIRASLAALPELRIYRRLRFGRLLELNVLDDRQYRSDNPCGDGESLRCEAALSAPQTMLGSAQESWLEQGLASSQARWNLFGQGLLVAELEHLPYEGQRFWNDAWDGYPLARERLLRAVVASGVANPVFLTGDWHSTFVNDLLLDFRDRAAMPVATEFATPAISSGGDGTPYGPYYGPMVPFNPHIKYFEGDRRGYFSARITEEYLQLDLRFMTSVESPSGAGYAERSFVVEAGRAGALPV